jgi:hypothetical protein
MSDSDLQDIVERLDRLEHLIRLTLAYAIGAATLYAAWQGHSAAHDIMAIEAPHARPEDVEAVATAVSLVVFCIGWFVWLRPLLKMPRN